MSKKLSKPQERKYNLIRGYLKNHTLILVGYSNDCTLLETLKKIWINKGRFYLWGRRDIRSSQGPRTITEAIEPSQINNLFSALKGGDYDFEIYCKSSMIKTPIIDYNKQVTYGGLK